MMPDEKKHSYIKGKEFVHRISRKTVIFGKWNEDSTASCISKSDKLFVNIPRETLDNDYISYSELNKKSRERRRGEGW